MKALSVAFLLLCLCLLPFTIFAEIKTFVHTVRQPFSGSQSPDDARKAATAKAKLEVLEKAGTYIESTKIVEKGRLTKDQFVALASGVFETEIISQEHYTTKEGFGIVVKVKVKVDTSVFEKQVEKVMTDPTIIEQMSAVHERQEELLKKMELLEEENRKLALEINTQAVEKKRWMLKNGFQETTKGLDAVVLNYQLVKLWKSGKYTNPRKAIELLDKAIKLDPGYVFAYNNRGFAYSDLKQYDRAIREFDKAIKIDPGYMPAYYNRGLMYGKYLKQYNRAIQDFDMAIELDPGYVKAYNSRGLAYKNLRQYNRAIQDFDMAIGLDPGYVFAYNNRGLAYIVGMGAKGRGCADFRKACELGDCKYLHIGKKRGVCY